MGFSVGSEDVELRFVGLWKGLQSTVLMPRNISAPLPGYKCPVPTPRFQDQLAFGELILKK